MSKTSISTDQELHKGDYLLSSNGNYKAVFEEDGNFVIYERAQIWSTETAGQNRLRVLVQADNNLVIYTNDYRAVWASKSYSPINSDRMRLTMTNNGQLVLDNDGKEIWCTPLPPPEIGVIPVEEKSKAKP